MNYTRLVISIFLISMIQSSLASSRCGIDSSAPILYSDDFKWNIEYDQAEDKFNEIYNSGKRLDKRAFKLNDKFLLPIDVLGEEKQLVLSSKFIKNLSQILEKAIERKYAEYLMIMDMGHTHFFLPKKFYQDEIRPLSTAQKVLLYQKLFDHDSVKLFFHTAEQIRMRDQDKKVLSNRHVQWRFHTRNLLAYKDGSNKTEILYDDANPANTIRQYKDHRYWGAGFSLSASKDGCFPLTVNGKTIFYDISFKNPGVNPSNGEVDL